MEIHTDQGRNFESGVFKELCRLLSLVSPNWVIQLFYFSPYVLYIALDSKQTNFCLSVGIYGLMIGISGVYLHSSLSFYIPLYSFLSLIIHKKQFLFALVLKINNFCSQHVEDILWWNHVFFRISESNVNDMHIDIQQMVYKQHCCSPNWRLLITPVGGRRTF